MSDNNNKPPKKPMGGPPMGGPPGMGPGGKADDFKGSLKKLFKYAHNYTGIMLFAVILSIVSATCSLLGPDELSKITNLIIDGMQTEINLDEIQEIGTFLFILYLTSLICGYTQSNIMATISHKLGKNLRSDLLKKLNNLPLSYFDKNSYGDTLSNVTNDVDTIGTSLNQSLSTIVSGIFTFSGALFLMFKTNAIMAISALLSTMIGFSLMGFIIKSSQKHFKGQQGHLGLLNGHIEEIYTGHVVVKAYNNEENAKNEFSINNKKLQESASKAQYFSGLMMPIMGFVGNFAYVVICIVGAVLALNRDIDFGVIVAFTIYIRLFTQPLANLAQAATTLQSAAAASERIFKLLEESELTDESNKKPFKNSVRGDVSFRNINFGYTSDKLIIKDFSTEIRAGQKVAIVGPTGAGKTTLVNLLMRFYELNSGEILIDNTSISDMTREDLHEIFAMVLQDTWLFEGSVKENIIYNKTNISEQEVINACKSVGVHHTIMTLPKGYDTIMSNSSLSVGEKQLITIARAMVKKADLLILDEATSSVDTRTEILIQNALDKLSNGKTSFIIAHRLSTIKNSDIILVMKDGNIIESGTHDELLSLNGFYAELYNSQFKEEDE